MEKIFNKENLPNTISIIALIVALLFNFWAVRDQNITLKSSERVASADYVLRLTQDLENNKYDNIKNILYDDKSNHLTLVLYNKTTNINGVIENKLDDYIGKLETIGDMTEEGIINKDMAYQEFSVDFIKTWCNDEIKNYILNMRNEDKALNKETTYFHGLEYLANYSMRKENKGCSFYDNK